MRIYLVLLLLIACVFTTQAQAISDFYPAGKLYGKVAKVTSVRYNRNHQSYIRPVSDTTWRDTVYYDERGNPVSRSIYIDRPGRHELLASYRYINKFNKEGKLVATEEVGKDRKLTIFFNENGIVTEDSLYTYRSKSNRTYLYDSKHKLIMREQYNGSGQLTEQMLYRINNKRLITQETMQFGLFHYTIQYTYRKFDHNENWTRKIILEKHQVAIGSGVVNDTLDRKISYY